MNEYKHDVGYIHKHSLQLEEYDSMTERVETFIDKIHYCIQQLMRLMELIFKNKKTNCSQR